MSNNSVIFFTTHIINKAIISEFKKICKTDGYDTVLCLDNSSNSFTSESDSPIQELEFYGEKYKCFMFDENIHKYMNLPNYTCKKDQSFKSIMWSNGDYRFYYIRKLEHGKIFSQLNDKTDNRWIHCEMFVPTELINNSFSHRYFEEYLYYKPEIDLNNDRVFEKQNGRLYHPIKGNYIERLNVLKQENKNLKKQIKELSYFKINILGIKIKIKRKIKNA